MLPTNSYQIASLKKRKTFYADFQKALSLKKANTIAIIALGANARTSYSNDETLPDNVIGKFTKGTSTNVNGHTLHFAAENNMTLTNTLFQHKNVQTNNLDRPLQTLKDEKW